MSSESGSKPYQIGPPSEKLVCALDSLVRNALVSAAVLEDILELGESPNNVLLLRDPRLVPACMELLRQHCSQSRVFGEDEYGLTCIRVISLCVQVDLLQAMDGLKPYLDQRQSRNFPVAGVLPYMLVQKNRWIAKSRANFRNLPTSAHSTTVLTSEHAGRLLDYFHRERDLLLKARMSTSKARDWDGWSILFYAMWDRLVAGNKANTIKTRLKLQDINCRFAVVKPRNLAEEDLLDFVLSCIKVTLTPEDLLPAPVDRPDRREINKAYLHRFSSDMPSLELSFALFDWVVLALEFDRADMVGPFFKISCDRLWSAIEATHDFPQVSALDINHGVSFADRIIGFIG
ncbi:hypothetical protein FS749_001642 [Ceratobasidium sp. UAMH 11750]|nr:hypothetical protein FS749_001642 [Ceratobasidium sp. UAMH 11750]